MLSFILLIVIFVNFSPEPMNLLAVISPFISKSFVANEKIERVVPNGVILSDII
jgi:hypothetical protein